MVDNMQCSPRSGRVTWKPSMWFVSFGKDIRAKQESNSLGMWALRIFTSSLAWAAGVHGSACSDPSEAGDTFRYHHKNTLREALQRSE